MYLYSEQNKNRQMPHSVLGPQQLCNLRSLQKLSSFYLPLTWSIALYFCFPLATFSVLSAPLLASRACISASNRKSAVHFMTKPPRACLCALQTMSTNLSFTRTFLHIFLCFSISFVLTLTIFVAGFHFVFA